MLPIFIDMIRIYTILSLLVAISFSAKAQELGFEPKAARAWADSVYDALSDDERIAQLMVLRLSSYDFNKKQPIFLDKEVEEAVKKYNIGGICLFQGNPVKQAGIINRLQALAKTPIMTCIDGEWGVGMRLFDSVQALPHQMMLGAMGNPDIIYQYGKLVAEQCKRLGINVNYAPVVDVNNNPNNPVINDRSFGEDKYKVALFATQYMRGLQENGVMACAKHFPGHGDVSVDSHYDLPVIRKSMEQLDSLELYPFREIFRAGIASVMVAHLYIPAIDKTANVATSISKNNVTDLLRKDLGFEGISFTDALEMQGVQKYFPGGEASVQSLIAGNDMLCLPVDIDKSIEKIKEAIRENKLGWHDIELHCKRVLMAKYRFGGTKAETVDPANITEDLNRGVPEMKKLVAENAITLLSKSNDDFFPLKSDSISKGNIAYVGIGLSVDNAFSKKMREEFGAAVFYFNYKQDASRILSTVELIKKKYSKVVIGIHGYNRAPANNFGISASAVNLVNLLQDQTNHISLVFGNPYAIRNFCNARNLVACYEDDPITQNAAIGLLKGIFTAKGKLPVTVCDKYKFGSGILMSDPAAFFLPRANPDELGMDIVELNRIDSIATNAINRNATPGCVVLVAKDGKIAYQKAFGYFNYDKKEPASVSSVYDIASVTKICATTLAVMKLYEEGKIDLKKKLGDYLPWVKGSNKAGITVESMLLHQGGLVSFIPFYKETIDRNGVPYTKYYAEKRSDSFQVEVAQNLFMRKDWQDTMYKRILESPLNPPNSYVYSDNDFIFLAKIVEAVTGTTIDRYVYREFYKPLGLNTIGFHPREKIPLNRIAPTEREKEFRIQLLRGDVHDPGAAMFGGVAGHAGLFSDANDMAVLMQLLLNKGVINRKRYLKAETVDLFTDYHSNISRRGYGFDKPEKDNDKRAEPYPCPSASPLTFGHTGFTGTCLWTDPAHNLIYVFLSNRLTPNGAENKKLNALNVRAEIQECIYRSLRH